MWPGGARKAHRACGPRKACRAELPSRGICETANRGALRGAPNVLRQGEREGGLGATGGPMADFLETAGFHEPSRATARLCMTSRPVSVSATTG